MMPNNLRHCDWFKSASRVAQNVPHVIRFYPIKLIKLYWAFMNNCMYIYCRSVLMRVTLKVASPTPMVPTKTCPLVATVPFGVVPRLAPTCSGSMWSEWHPLAVPEKPVSFGVNFPRIWESLLWLTRTQEEYLDSKIDRPPFHWSSAIWWYLRTVNLAKTDTEWVMVKVYSDVFVQWYNQLCHLLEYLKRGKPLERSPWVSIGLARRSDVTLRGSWITPDTGLNFEAVG